ncbi:hypothetical protein [Planktothrix mougeotii]|uniref:hypothetical protein n=1 Tax=Planktothrix mougeotii TaxID=54306 RepID=UPI001880CE83|nr:hypothetical protein [Planktothrix mougeotii]
MYQVQAGYEFYIIVGNYIRLPRDLAIWIAGLNCIFQLNLGLSNTSTPINSGVLEAHQYLRAQ